MKKNNCRMLLFASLASQLLVIAAWAQPGGDRGDRGDRGGRGGFDMTAAIKGWDKNGNGIIEPNELDDRSRRFAESIARRGGLDISQPIPLDKFITASQIPRDGGPPGSSSSGSNNGDSRGGDSRSGDRERSDSERNSSSPAKPAAPPATPGFGTSTNAPKAAGFDVPLAANAAASLPLEQRFDARVLEYVDKMLRDYDKNHDGFVDNIEWKDGKWSTPPEESDTNKDGKLSKAELCERIARRFGLTGPPGSNNGGSNSGGTSSRDSGSNSGGGDFAKFREHAANMIKQYDRNSNGVLEREKDEWKDLKSEHRAADADNNNVITVDELALKLQAYSASPGGSTYGSRDSKSGDGKSRFGSSKTSTKPGEKKDYRFQTASDRLPKGLPDWFLRSDADSDGQVAMVEYATNWTDTTAAEFAKFDLDGDGFITPQECLAAASTAPKK